MGAEVLRLAWVTAESAGPFWSNRRQQMSWLSLAGCGAEPVMTSVPNWPNSKFFFPFSVAPSTVEREAKEKEWTHSEYRVRQVLVSSW